MRFDDNAVVVSGGCGGIGFAVARFLLEREYGYPVTVIRTTQLGSANLDDFNVVILPDGGFGEGYDSVLGAGGARRLKDWVDAGGTLIGLGPGAVSYLAETKTGLVVVEVLTVTVTGLLVAVPTVLVAVTL